MKLLIFLSCVTAVVFSTIMVASQNKASEAEVHLKRACEAVWTNANKYTIDRCVKRAMSAMSIQNRLRDNELKRLLTASERELAACKEELEKTNESEPLANFIPWRGRTHQPPRR